MRDGFIKVAAGTPKIRVADCRYNAEQIFTLMREADKQGVRVLALPELCLTGYTCGDLFLQDTLLRGAEEALATILEATKHLDILAARGAARARTRASSTTAPPCSTGGRFWAWCPRPTCPTTGNSMRSAGSPPAGRLEQTGWSPLLRQQGLVLAPGASFPCESMPKLVLGVEICEDLWASEPPSVALAEAGATLILNLSASDEMVGKAEYRRALVSGQSARLVCGYVYADAGEGESTTDLVFAGHNLIAENGALLAERRFATGLTVTEIDVDKLVYERRRMTTFPGAPWRSRGVIPGLLRPGAVHHHPHPPCQPHALRPGGRRRPGRNGARRSLPSPPWASKSAWSTPAHRRRWWACPAGWTPPWPSSSPAWP